MNSPLPPLKLTHGTSVCYRGRHCLICQESSDFSSILLFDPETSQLEQAAINELTALPERQESPEKELWLIQDSAWSDALKTYQIIAPLLPLKRRTRAVVKERADAAGVSASTIYNWLKDFDRVGRVSVFLRKPRSDSGSGKLASRVEEILQDVIDSHYLSMQKLSVAKIVRQIAFRCQQENLEPPHASTVRRRLIKLDRYQTIKAREGRKAADAETRMIKRHFDDAIVPLQLVQVDHTPVDVILVDDAHRLPIGRPWLTLLIDVFSRMVLGFCISLDPPGNLSLGLCLSHAFLPKDKWLTKMGLNSQWPCWGLPRTIHADNAKEFRGDMLRKACEEYGINLEWRPVATPRYGAHIERYLGTLNEAIHGLPGTTFSNPSQKGEYDSSAQAAMTLRELEAWVTNQIVDIYHQQPHSSLGMSPLAKWKEGLIGTKRAPGIGLPVRISNEQKLKLDLLPFEYRTVQDYGIVWDGIEYRADVLRRWILEKDPDNPKMRRRFVCRRDPRDISVIWFYDPEVGQYYDIPYRNTSHPAISLWELRAARIQAEQEAPTASIDEARIFAAYERLMAIEASAKVQTKKIRRAEQRKRLGLENSRSYVAREATKTSAEPNRLPTPERRRDIKPFDVDDL